MKSFNLTSSTFAAAALALVTLAPGVAKAEKPGVLEGKPIVERRLELRKLRIQISPHVGMSIAQPFVHVGTVGGKLEFDFTDWVGLRGTFGYAAVNVPTELTERMVGDGGSLKGVLPKGVDNEDETDITQTKAGPHRYYWQRTNPAPLEHDFKAGLTRLQWQASLDVVFTPFAGKLGLFSGIFTEYDMYIFGGFGIVQWSRMYPGVDSTATQLGLTQADHGRTPSEGFCAVGGQGEKNDDCVLHPVDADDGIRFGGSIGGGFHIFVSDWFSVNPEIQDIIVQHNHAGLNTGAGSPNEEAEIYPVVRNDYSATTDRAVTHNVTFRLGLNFYFPPRAKRSTLKP